MNLQLTTGFSGQHNCHESSTITQTHKHTYTYIEERWMSAKVEHTDEVHKQKNAHTHKQESLCSEFPQHEFFVFTSLLAAHNLPEERQFARFFVRSNC